MPPPELDAKARTAFVGNIAKRLAALQKTTPASQLDMARTVEAKVFETAKTLEDYRHKIEKRLAKADAARRRGGQHAARAPGKLR